MIQVVLRLTHGYDIYFPKLFLVKGCFLRSYCYALRIQLHAYYVATNQRK